MIFSVQLTGTMTENRYDGFKLGDANVQFDDTLLLIEPEAARPISGQPGYWSPKACRSGWSTFPRRL